MQPHILRTSSCCVSGPRYPCTEDWISKRFWITSFSRTDHGVSLCSRRTVGRPTVDRFIGERSHVYGREDRNSVSVKGREKVSSSGASLSKSGLAVFFMFKRRLVWKPSQPVLGYPLNNYPFGKQIFHSLPTPGDNQSVLGGR